MFTARTPPTPVRSACGISGKSLLEDPMPMMRFTKTVLCTTALAVAAGLTLPQMAAAQDAKKGQEVYTAQKCGTCHGKMVPLAGIGKKLSADEIKEWITHPKEMTEKTKSTKKPPMPDKYGSLSAG